MSDFANPVHYRASASTGRRVAAGRACPRILLGALALASAAGCGGDPKGGQSGVVEPAPATLRERDMSSAAVALRAAIDAGQAGRAEELLAALEGRLGVEEPCLRARLAFLRGEESAWLADLEVARAAAPRDPRSYATAAELWAAAGQLDAARAELDRGVAATGELTPELERAKGVLALVQPGGTRVGFECLQRALARDPQLPFVARPMGQAYLLLAKAALAEQNPAAALEALDHSIAYDPDDLETQELRAQALYANERFREAIDAYEDLLARGRDVRGELALWHKNLGFLAQVAGDDAAAQRHYLRGRELGLSDDELGTGRHFLHAAAQAALCASAEREAAGVRGALDAGLVEVEPLVRDVAALRGECAAELLQRAIGALSGEEVVAAQGALASVEASLLLAPEVRLARILRAKLYFAAGSFLEAAEDFAWVVDDARTTGDELPEPVHLHLSACLDASGEPAAAKQVLDAYLLDHPEGRWLETTRARLRQLGE
ncbi:MAG: hypothetical protein R3F49_15275 [Planctomycetota bacterium]